MLQTTFIGLDEAAVVLEVHQVAVKHVLDGALLTVGVVPAAEKDSLQKPLLSTHFVPGN